MMLLKACPHCGGDLSVDHDRACGYLECVQCGHVLSLRQELALGVKITRQGVLRHESHSAPADDGHAPRMPMLVIPPER